MKKIREDYLYHMTRMFELAGYNADDAKIADVASMRIETRLAKAQYDNVKLRDPMGNYNKMTIDQLKNDYPNFNWDAYLQAAGANVAEISVSQPEPVKEAIAIMNDENLDDVKSYMAWRLIDASAPYLSEAIGEENFSFSGQVLSVIEYQ